MQLPTILLPLKQKYDRQMNGTNGAIRKSACLRLNSQIDFFSVQSVFACSGRVPYSVLIGIFTGKYRAP